MKLLYFFFFLSLLHMLIFLLNINICWSGYLICILLFHFWTSLLLFFYIILFSCLYSYSYYMKLDLILFILSLTTFYAIYFISNLIFILFLHFMI
jgi:hypothetical protein